MNVCLAIYVTPLEAPKDIITLLSVGLQSSRHFVPVVHFSVEDMQVHRLASLPMVLHWCHHPHPIHHLPHPLLLCHTSE